MLQPSTGTGCSLEFDILQLSQRWEAQRTIRNGDTPAQALRGSRTALASISANAAPRVDRKTPFSLTCQRQIAVAGQAPSSCCQPEAYVQNTLQSVRFAGGTSTAATAAVRQQSGNAGNQRPSRTATPGHALSFGKTAAATAKPQAGGASCDSPSPDILFRGRLSFAAAEADSARKYDTQATVVRRQMGASNKRKLVISPGADISAAFPTLVKPVAKQRRRSLSDTDARWSSQAMAADPAAHDAAAASAQGASAATASHACVLRKYWSDPLPVPAGLAAEVVPAARVPVAADEEMEDTTASPASSISAEPGGMCSPALCATACSGLGHSPTQPVPVSPIPGQQQHVLPTVDQPDCAFPAITATTMRDLLVHGAPAFGLAAFVVVDCRYAYEFEGGRLPGALHLTTPEAIEGFLAQPHGSEAGSASAAAGSGAPWQRTAIIFHCEFSTERGPRAAKWVRNQDRTAHMHDYPALSHPHVFVLQGGFKAFWRAFPELCEGGYRPMDHPDFTDQLKACHKVAKQAWAKTTRTYSLKQRQRRPSYRLRQSNGVLSGSTRDCDMAGAEEAASEEAHLMERPPPAWRAAQHSMRTHA